MVSANVGSYSNSGGRVIHSQLQCDSTEGMQAVLTTAHRPTAGHPCTFAQQALERRNIHIKRFEGIPIADTELIFPDKTIFLKPLTILQLAVTLIGGLVAAFATLWGVRHACTPS